MTETLWANFCVWKISELYLTSTQICRECTRHKYVESVHGVWIQFYSLCVCVYTRVCTHLHSCALTCVYACVYVCIRLSVKLEHDSMFFQVENNVTTNTKSNH